MLLSGTTEHTLDGSLRLAIPARFRNQWQTERDGGGWMCLPWTGCLRLYTEGAFKELAGPLLKGLLPGSNQARIQKQVFGRAVRLEHDSAGRIMLPKAHLVAAGMKCEPKSEVVLVGAGNRLEVYEKEAWAAEESMDLATLQDLINDLERQGGQPG